MIRMIRKHVAARKSKRIQISVHALIIACVAGIGVCVFTNTCFSDEKTSFQLLPNRGVGVLKSVFIMIKTHNLQDSNSHLEVYNRTSHTLTIDLNGKDGRPRYHLTLGPRTNKMWTVENGRYHAEMSIPGFPPDAGELFLDEKSVYQWTLERVNP